MDMKCTAHLVQLFDCLIANFLLTLVRMLIVPSQIFIVNDLIFIF